MTLCLPASILHWIWIIIIAWGTLSSILFLFYVQWLLSTSLSDSILHFHMSAALAYSLSPAAALDKTLSQWTIKVNWLNWYERGFRTRKTAHQRYLCWLRAIWRIISSEASTTGSNGNCKISLAFYFNLEWLCKVSSPLRPFSKH